MDHYYLNWLNKHQFHGIKPGLYRIISLLKALGNPQVKYPTIHVAGTNGKGSTCAILSAVLSKHGLKTGLYTSPHLFKLNERFKINNKEIPDNTLLELLKILHKFAPEPITYFELTTALAFLYFAEEKVDIAVIETGLGGRLDATNVIHPLVSVITTIGFDHTKYLGKTIKKIAFEKAGIIKRGKPVVIGKVSEEAKEVILKRAEALSSPVYLLGRDFFIFSQEGLWNYHGKNCFKELKLSLQGAYQGQNLALSLKTLEILKENAFLPLREDILKEALLEVKWEGRFKRIFLGDKEILLDCAHNPQGAEALRASLEKEKFYPYLLLLGATNEDGEKPFPLLLEILSNYAQKIFLSEFTAERKVVTKEEWERALAHKGNIAPIEYFKNPAQALESVLKDESCHKILITGSIYFIGNILSILEKIKYA